MATKRSRALEWLSTPLLLSPAIIMLVIFLILGLVYGLNISLVSNGGYTLQNYATVFEGYSDTLLFTLSMSAGITIILAVLCLPVAYYLAIRVKSDTIKLVALLLMLVPFWTDWNIRAISWYPVLGATGFFNIIYSVILQSLGFQNVEPLRILFTSSGVWLSWIQTYILFMIAPVYLVLLRMDPKLIKAAATLRANSVKTFYHITLKWAAPGLVIGSVFVFCMAMADYATPSLIGGQMPVIGFVIWILAAKAMAFDLAIALSAIVLAIIIALVVAMLKLVDVTRVMY